MSGVDGSRLRLQPPAVAHGPQILLPVHNRLFPMPTAAEARLYARFQARSLLPDPDKPRESAQLKPTIKKVHKVASGRGITEQGIKEESRTHVSPTAPAAGREHKIRKQKNKRLMPQMPVSVDGVRDPLGSSCRYDSSLSLLTKKFVNLLQQQKDGTLDLNRAAELLEVQKRRIYDITNVLEGVGLMEKNLKNRIRWKGDEVFGSMELDNQIAELKVANESLFKEECRIDKMIREMEEILRVLKERDQKHLYITEEDINKLPCFQNSTLMAIKAPHGTSIEVPYPDEGLGFSQRRYQIFLRTSMGPINCFLISNQEERLAASNEGQQPIPMDCSIDNSKKNKDDGSSTQSADKATARTSGPIQEADIQKMSSDPSIYDENVSGLVKIVPPNVDIDADYWFETGLQGSLTDMWNE